MNRQHEGVSLKKILSVRHAAYRVDCGGCNGCESKFCDVLSPLLLDAERFGIKAVPSPRHADILPFTGAAPPACLPALRAWQSAPTRKSVSSTVPAATAAASSMICTASGAVRINRTGGCVHSGCPPTPAATLYGFAMALGLLEQKITPARRVSWTISPQYIPHPDMVQLLRVKVIARRAGWRVIAMVVRCR